MHINIPTPSVPSPLQLQVGSTYRNRAGELVRITGTNKTTWPFTDSHDRTYLPSGAYWSDYAPCRDDLIELVSDTKADDTKPANDAEAVTPITRLQVGSTYRDRAGQLVRITGKSTSEDARWPYVGDANCTYNERGRYWDNRTNDFRDLIAWVSDGEAATAAKAEADAAAKADAADVTAEVPPLQLEVGATYRNRIGEVVRIKQRTGNVRWPFSDGQYMYTTDGRRVGKKMLSIHDLMERISDAPESAELPTGDADQADQADDADTWITDRLPTAEDADCHGDIELRDPPIFGPWPYHPCACVITGEVWRRTKWHPSRSNTAAPTPSTPSALSMPSMPAPLTAPPTTPLNPFASIRRTVLADGTHILDAIDTAGNAWHRIIGATDFPWELTTPLPKLPRS